MSLWAVVGSGPSGRALTWRELAEPTVIAVNTAIFRVPWEHVDIHAFRWGAGGMHKRRFNDIAEAGIRRVAFGNVKLPKLSPLHAWMLNLEQAECRDMWDKEKRGLAPIPAWRRGTYSPFRDPVGPQAVQLAINEGATEIMLYGMEGGDRKDDGSLDQHQADAAEYQRQILQVTVCACPDVMFVFHGDPVHQLEGDNIAYPDLAPP